MSKDSCLRKWMVVVGAMGVSALLLAACGSNSTALNPNKKKASLGNEIVMANAALNHSPNGSADLSWDPATQRLVVKLSALGLAPKSVHPVDIQAGTCRQAGVVKYALTSLVADNEGAASSVTTVENVKGGIPQANWSINVHNGASAQPGQQKLIISCADVQNTQAKGQAVQEVHANLGAAYAPNQQASGVVQLRLADKSLTVTVTMTGLAPKSLHMASIYSGACETQGKVLYPLKPIKADTQGNGSSITILNGVSAIQQGWYVNVHMTGDPATQKGNDPIACGNIRTAG